MMAMSGSADLLSWRGLPENVQKDFSQLTEEFRKTYGGNDDEMSKAIHTLSSMKQGKGLMVTFGLRMQLLVMTVCHNNEVLQLSYFY